MKNKFFISGIDTGIGKTVASGRLAKLFSSDGKKVITQKLIQTGCSGISEDILEHRKICGVPVLPEDSDFTTCKYVFSYPASPHIAAKIDGVKIDIQSLADNTEKLLRKYDIVIVEGAGGLTVPLTDNFLTADYIVKYSLPLILVVSSRLGSLNHALLSLEFARSRGMELEGIVYNVFPKVADEIENSTLAYLKNYISKEFIGSKIWKMDGEKIWRI